MKKAVLTIYTIVIIVGGVLMIGKKVLTPILPIVIFIMSTITRIILRTSDKKHQEEDMEEEPGDTAQAETKAPESTVITCDYCGSKVDTELHTVCDHCGGPYYDDEEWKKIRNKKNCA